MIIAESPRTGQQVTEAGRRVTLVDMKVALLSGNAWITEEANMVRYLAVGLIDEQVRLVPVTPFGCARPTLSSITERVHYGSARVTWWRRTPGRVAHTLRGAEVELLHALDPSVYPLAAYLSRQIGIPLICSCWSASDVVSIARARPDAATVFLLPSEPLALRARQLLGERTTIELVRPGVMSPGSQATEALAEPAEALCCLMVSDGRVDVDCMALLRGVTMVRSRLPHIQIMLYAMGGQYQRLWQAAGKLDLLGHISLVDAEPETRELLVQADAVLVPQPLGAVRTIVLEAMAAQRPVIAAADGMVDHLLEGRTARLIAEPTADRWADYLQQLASMPRAFRSLGQAAAAHVKQQYAVSASVERHVKVYRQVTGEPLAFEAGTAEGQ